MAPNNKARSLDALLTPAKFEPFPETDTPSDFNQAWEEKQGWVFASMSHAAYLPGLWVEDKMARLGAVFARAYDIDGAQAFLAIWPGKAVLSFRGTQPVEKRSTSTGDLLHTVSLNDLVADLGVKRVRFGDAKVHRGFLGELDKLWGCVLSDLKLRVEENSVYATGHSLGAAMATLAGMRCKFAGVVTFGEPRVGCFVEREFQADGHTRYVNGDDPATKFPPSGLWRKYRHHGEAIPLGDSRVGFLRPDVIFDHSILDYEEKLLNCKGAVPFDRIGGAR